MKRLCGVLLSLAVVTALCGADKEAKPAGDPAAEKLLADAHAARAVWKDFPGFTADLEVNIDGKATKGTVSVDPKGDVTLDLPDGEPKHWARQTLASVVGHRLDDGEPDTPCVFEDDNVDHPLGRAVRVLGDEFHSSYRIRGDQVIVVKRETKDARFAITVQLYQINKEKKNLPLCFVVNAWDKAGALTSSEAHFQFWKRVDAFDLPYTVVVATAGTIDKQEARSLKLSNHKLNPGAAK